MTDTVVSPSSGSSLIYGLIVTGYSFTILIVCCQFFSPFQGYFLSLVDNKSSEIERKLEDVAYQVMWDHDFKPIISLKVFAESRFKSAVKRGISFYENVQKEGVSV